MAKAPLAGIEPTAREIAAAEAETAEDLAAVANNPFPPSEEELPPEEVEPGSEPAPAEPDEITLAHQVYLGTVIEALGPDAQIVPCGSCGGFGFKPFELADDPHTEVCPDCNGWGETLTRSHVAGQVKRMCPGCRGQGWRPIGTVHALPPQTGDRPQAPNGFYYDPLGNLVPLPA